MKKTIIVALVLFVTTVNGQKKDYYLDKLNRNLFKVESQKLITTISLNSDTLHILDFATIKFIKIGDRVYKIESPTLIEAFSPLDYNPHSLILGLDTNISKPRFWINKTNTPIK